jgi:hypothetical protein
MKSGQRSANQINTRANLSILITQQSQLITYSNSKNKDRNQTGVIGLNPRVFVLDDPFMKTLKTKLISKTRSLGLHTPLYVFIRDIKILETIRLIRSTQIMRACENNPSN